MLAIGILFYHDLVAYLVGVVTPGEVLAAVILQYHFLLAFFDVLPVSLKGDI